MRIDLHVHTSRYSDCGRSTAEAMVERAISEGLDALVFTEHNVFWPEDALTALRRRYNGITLLRGAEFTSSDGEDLLIYGPIDPTLEQLRRDPESLVRRIHELGGAVILAHPYRYHDHVPAWLDRMPVDAIEVMSSNIYAHTSAMARELARSLGLPCVVTSDGHHVDSLGWYSMQHDGDLADEFALARAIQTGALRPHVSESHIAAENAALAQTCARIRELVALGLGDDEIRAAAPQEFVSYTLIRGVRQGRDMSRPGSF